jgi:hypothetical protein
MEPKTERPVVRCFIAKPIPGGRGDVERSRIVPLSVAFSAMQAGWMVVGPDPDDWEALMAWEQAQAQPFNGPRVSDAN